MAGQLTNAEGFAERLGKFDEGKRWPTGTARALRKISPSPFRNRRL